jgi:hypothetical protein
MANPASRPNLVLPFATKFDQLSLSSCYLEARQDSKPIGHASGFFWRANTALYLVTNWHVVTGKDPLSKNFLHMGQCPDTLHVHYTARAETSSDMTERFGADARAFLQRQISVPLYSDYHAPFWIQHRDCLRAGIDVVLVPLSAAHLGDDANTVVCVSDYGFLSLLNYIGADLLIVGYPLHDPSPKFPVWKRGSIASELIAGWRKKPAFLVDCRTSKGMSGSPVIRRVFGPAAAADMTINLDAVVTSQFMGVYSGRLHDDESVASIGLVWWPTVIHEIIEQPAPGDRGE